MTALWRNLTMCRMLAESGRGGSTPHEATGAMREAAGRENPRWGAYSWLAPKAEMQARHAGFPGPDGAGLPGSGPPGPLAGFACAVKANLAVEGWPCDCGSRLLQGYLSPYDATVVRRLRAAGCGFLGVAAMDEFGMGSSCEFSCHGPVRNPWRPDCTPGGSSGGGAAAVAAGLAWFALGSDTGGSVRLPAHCCGVVGFKPTYGRISRFGLTAYASSLDTVGILARSVGDAALVYQAIAGRDPQDATTAVVPVAPCPDGPPDRQWRVGVVRPGPALALEPAAAASFTQCLGIASKVFGKMKDVDSLVDEGDVGVYTILAFAEAASNLARFDGSLYGQRDRQAEGGRSFGRMVRAVRSAGFGPEVKRRILLGTHVLSTGYRARTYDRAQAARRRLIAAFAEGFSRCDLLILPTASGGAFPLGSRLADPAAMYATDRFTVPASLAGLPAVTIPTGLDDRGLPLSVQLVGPPWSEATLLAAAQALEAEFRFRERKEAPWNR
ncbi:MAG: amidase family protein [bacterium]